MQVFISWSGEVSNRIAVLLRDWLPNVLQAVRPFVSSQDIAKGSRGMDHIAEQLASTDYGILVLTSENVKAPWVNFEAGALSKSLGKSNVIPLLCGLRELDMQNSPLRQFQHSKIERADMFAVVSSLNSGCAVPLDATRLQSSFDQWWGSFANAYATVDFDPADVKPDTGPAIGTELSNVLENMLQEMSSIRREIKASQSLQDGWGREQLGGLFGLGSSADIGIRENSIRASNGLLGWVSEAERARLLNIDYLTEDEKNYAEGIRRAAENRRNAEEGRRPQGGKPNNKPKT